MASRDPREMFAAGALSAVLSTILGALLFIQSGLFNVAASKPHTKFTEWLTHKTMIASVKLHARGIENPNQATAVQVISGFCAYEAHCVACHGAAGVARQQWVNGMTPAPPYLLDAPRNWTPAELFWIVKHGIKLTAMPAWRDELGDRVVWNVVAFLEATQKMPPQAYLEWRSRGICAPRR